MSEAERPGRFSSFEDFWPFYVAEHSLPLTRRLHFVGTTLLWPILALAVISTPLWLLAAPVAGYGFAWAAHFFVQKNRPATFTHPLWSLRGDFRMYRLMLLGKMDAEVARLAGATSPG